MYFFDTPTRHVWSKQDFETVFWFKTKLEVGLSLPLMLLDYMISVDE